MTQTATPGSAPVFRKRALAAAARLVFAAAVPPLAAVTALALVPVAQAQSNVDGYIYGTAPAGTILIEGLESGVKATVSVDESGRFRSTALPAGSYRVTLKREGSPDLVRQTIVRIGSGASIAFAEDEGEDVAEVVVTGSAFTPIDIQSVETAVNFSAEELAKLAVARNVTAIALLAPGTVKGDTAFGNLASFNGSSVAENVYYFNGFNITNFRNGLGFSGVPYEFFGSFQVKTSGYGAEFGRSTGGVVNAVSKRGGDTFEGGVNAYWEPAALRAKAPSSRYAVVDEDTGETTYESLVDNSRDKEEVRTVNVFASGPVVPGHLSFYALGQFEDHPSEYVDSGEFFERDRSNPFWGVKLDGTIVDGHNLEYTYYRNRDEYTDTSPGSSLSGLTTTLGGETQILRYTGQILDNLTVSALAGRAGTRTTPRSPTAVRSMRIQTRVPPTSARRRFRSPTPSSTSARPTAWTSSGACPITACAPASTTRRTLRRATPSCRATSTLR
ncbi:MAG: hypothetical protein QM661_15115 [Solimonas sp.]